MIPSEFWQGVEEFNQEQFYACHDTLEALWIEAIEPDKRFYQGVLQIAVGCYHLTNLNWRGAAILMGEGLRRLSDYPENYSGINVDNLMVQTEKLLETLQITGVENIETLVAEGINYPKIARI